MSIREISNTLIRGEKAIVFPLQEAVAGMIHDKEGNHVLDIRGWGRLQYHENGEELQDGIAAWIVKTLNEAYEQS
jgi:hypothetical protein